ncbi:YcxB family protein [Bacillus shivajii]|uniref:YcxB family protein n=1 Tax=Bacillus shivajii TaxID=1983719 RepID=UPI001CFC1B4C|nr:YcxB family protein [Bacillus shivajii]UCZ53515.1 YcxB family protein [Bacillus shivajii]
MTHKEEVTVSGALKLDDLLHHNRYHNKKFVLGYFLFAFILMFILSANAITGSLILVVIINGFIALLVAGTVTFIFIFLLRLKVSKEFKSDQMIKSEMTYTVNEEGINQTLKRSNTHYEWTDILSVYEQDVLFQLYVSKNKAILLPKRFFETKQERELFKDIVTRYITTKKVKLKG